MPEQQKTFWEQDEREKSNEHVLNLIDAYAYYEAMVKPDGCVHLFGRNNGPTDDDLDYIRIRDLDEFIERLQALKQKAIEHFGEWPG